MTIEELNSVLNLKALIDSERAKLEDLRLCSVLSTSKLSGLPKARALSSATEKFAVKIVEAEEHIATLETKLGEAQADLVTKLQAALKDKSALWQSVLVRHYCGGLSFRVIAAQMNFTVDYIQLLHRQAASFVTNGEWRPRRGRRR